MSARTGLGSLETSVLHAVAQVAAGHRPPFASCRAVLDVLEERSGIAPRYAYPVVVDLTVPWRCHLPLLRAHGNFGSQGDEPPADAKYAQVRLSAVGRLALAAERGEVGPVPLGLVEGSFYREGPVPPFDPRAVVAALLERSGDAGPPSLPTGGRVEGDVRGLLAGRTARLLLCCPVVLEPGTAMNGGRVSLVVTAVPLGTNPDRVPEMIASRVEGETRPPWAGDGRRRAHYLPDGEPPERRPHLHPVAADVRDESSGGRTRIVVVLRRGVDPVLATTWLRDIWPVTVDVRWRLPAPQSERLRGWDRGDGSGLAALAALLGRQRRQG